jgi:branched-chain amino acid aminotransferase
MLDIDYDEKNGGWKKPIIKPREDFILDPSNATLHYSLECFEGMKAYVTDDNNVQLFRPEKNGQRMNISHKQLGFPSFDVKEYVECIRELVKVEKAWIPNRPLHSCYIRPASICMDNRLGLSSVSKSKTFVVLSPIGPYYPKGFTPVKLYSGGNLVRAWPHGYGDKKIGG